MIMINKEEAKEKILNLAREFSELTKEDYSSKSENQIKSEFIDPFFEALGWDMRKNADRETQILRGRADYILSLANKEVLIIEAKKADVKLEEEEGRQAVSYGYHRKIKFAVLTNFKQIRVFHALSNIKNVFANQLFWADFQDFERNFDKIWLLSKESFEKGELEKLIPSKDQKTAIPIDERILGDLLQIRKWLSNELKNKRMELSEEYIDEIVQIMIDRLIFMRSVEDRGLEGDGFLLKIVEDVQKGLTDKNLWALLKEQFVRFDNTYNSKLFARGILEEQGAFGDDTLKKVIKTLYFGLENNYEKYMFDKIPGDLFGNIYEQYLGTILAGTEKRVKLDSASGKRKKMGIYYTPSYITDYIVKNTVGEYIKNMTIDEILEVNIVDPACGSGSFLIRAFKEVCDRVEILLHQGKFSSKWTLFKDYKGRLSFGQKSDILRRCIYGVDLDEKAVELAQLNLLLKVFEGEERDLRVRKLPNLYENIQNGNSLIDDIKVAGDKAFNWHLRFKEVFDNGGFDVVIGNPPYIKIQTFTGNNENSFFEKNYVSSTGNFDIYVLFVEKAHKILRDSGVMGFILPHKFFQSDFGEGIRKYILDSEALRKIVDFRDNQIFDGATTYTCLLFLNKNKNLDYTYLAIDKDFKQENSLSDFEKSESRLKIANLGVDKWTFSNDANSKIFNKINENRHSSLKEFCKAIFQGIATGLDGVFFLTKIKEDGKFTTLYSKSLDRNVVLESTLLKPLVKGNMPKRFAPVETNQVILFPYFIVDNKVSLIEEKELKDKFPKVHSYLKEFEKELRGREGRRFDNKGWYCFSRNQGMSYLEKKKILTPDICQKGESAVDYDGKFLTTTTVYGVIPNEYKHFEFLLSILNSSLLKYFIRNTGSILRGGFFRYKTAYLGPFPIRLPSPSQEKVIVDLVNQMLELQKKYHDEKIAGGEKERIKRQIDATDYEIDQEVYKLYGLTSEEIKVVEESLK